VKSNLEKPSPTLRPRTHRSPLASWLASLPHRASQVKSGQGQSQGKGQAPVIPLVSASSLSSNTVGWRACQRVCRCA
jgi:hypothetical protein